MPWNTVQKPLSVRMSRRRTCSMAASMRCLMASDATAFGGTASTRGLARRGDEHRTAGRWLRLAVLARGAGSTGAQLGARTPAAIPQGKRQDIGSSSSLPQGGGGGSGHRATFRSGQAVAGGRRPGGPPTPAPPASRPGNPANVAIRRASDNSRHATTSIGPSSGRAPSSVRPATPSTAPPRKSAAGPPPGEGREPDLPGQRQVRVQAEHRQEGADP